MGKAPLLALAIVAAGVAAAASLAQPPPGNETWLEAVDATGVNQPGPGKPVIVVDRGLDLTQPDLAGRPDTFVLNKQSFRNEPDSFHATAMASIVGAPGRPGGLTGIYPRARIYSWDASPTGFLNTRYVLPGMKVASRHCPGVILLSMGFSGEFFLHAKSLLAEGIDLAVQRGCLVVAAGGNERDLGSPPFYPADLPHVLAVAALDSAGAVASFSSASPAIDVAAPGVDIPIDVPLSSGPTGRGSGVGTSYAAAIVAGAAALVWTLRPELRAEQVAEVLRRSAHDLGPTGRDPDTGAGLVDVAAALTTPAPPPDPLEPNDDIWYDLPLGLPNAGSKPVTTPTRANAEVAASVMPIKDPIDVYRVWVPPRRTVEATVAGAPGIGLRLWGADAATVYGTGGDPRAGLLAGSPTATHLRFTSRAGRGRYLYLEVSTVDSTGAAEYYTLRVSTG